MSTTTAISIVETNSVPRGLLVTDTMVKRSDVKVIESCPLCPGKYFVMVSGEVGPVSEALSAGVEAAGAFLVDSVLVPDVHRDVLAAVLRALPVPDIDALGIIETHSMATCVEVADTVAKSADVRLVELRLSRCLGGKSFVSFTGDVAAVSLSAQSGEDLARSRGQLVNGVVIPRLHRDLLPFVV